MENRLTAKLSDEKIAKFYAVASDEEIGLFYGAMGELMTILEDLGAEILCAWFDNYFSKKDKIGEKK